MSEHFEHRHGQAYLTDQHLCFTYSGARFDIQPTRFNLRRSTIGEVWPTDLWQGYALDRDVSLVYYSYHRNTAHTDYRKHWHTLNCTTVWPDCTATHTRVQASHIADCNEHLRRHFRGEN